MNDLTRKYIDDKQAAYRYGYSRQWFQRARWAGNGPFYLKIGNRVLYPLIETDLWFEEHGLRQHTSQLSK